MRTVAPDAKRVLAFGSRLDDPAKGGDVDVLIEFADPVPHPAWLNATIAARAMRCLGGRHGDVVIKAPNLQTSAIHEIALPTGEEL